MPQSGEKSRYFHLQNLREKKSAFNFPKLMTLRVYAGFRCFCFLKITVLGRFRPVECEKNWVLLWVLFMECSLSLCYDDFYIANAGEL